MTDGSLSGASAQGDFPKQYSNSPLKRLPPNDPVATAAAVPQKQVELPLFRKNRANPDLSGGSKHDTEILTSEDSTPNFSSEGSPSPRSTDLSLISEKAASAESVSPKASAVVGLTAAAGDNDNLPSRGDVTMTSNKNLPRDGGDRPMEEDRKMPSRELPQMSAAGVDVGHEIGGGLENSGASTEISEEKALATADEEASTRSPFWSESSEGCSGVAKRYEGDDCHGSSQGSLSSREGGPVARVAQMDSTSDASTFGTSSSATPEELAEEAAGRDTQCAAEASWREARLPKPRLRPPLPTDPPDETDQATVHAANVAHTRRLERSSSPRGEKLNDASAAAIARPEDAAARKLHSAPYPTDMLKPKPMPLMLHQSSSSDDLGGSSDGEEDHDLFEEEPASRRFPHLGTNGLNRARHSMLTVEDIEICQKLDEEYERALEEREIGWEARYKSVRQSACFSLSFMFVYLALGTIFFQRQTAWEIHDSLLFTIYTITTVGYGNHYIPTTPGVQTFIIFYIFVGIATLTIMVAQVYQCIALEATRAQYSRDKAEIDRRGNDLAAASGFENDGSASNMSGGGPSSDNSRTNVMRQTSADSARYMMDSNETADNRRSCSEWAFDATVVSLEATKNFLRHTQIGRGVSVILPFTGLILIGAIVVGPIEGWTFIESVYFAVVSLTTVGFGDYHPTEDASIWFCIFWLPFSVGFMSLYLGSIAHFYIGLSNSNIQRMERKMRRRIRKAKEAAERERQAAFTRAMAAAGQEISVESGGEDQTVPQDVPSPQPQSHKRRGFETLPLDSDAEDEGYRKSLSQSALFGSPEHQEGSGLRRRERILQNASNASIITSGSINGDGNKDEDIDLRRPMGQTMSTMKDVLRAVKAHRKRKSSVVPMGKKDSVSSVFVGGDVMGSESEFMSIRSSQHSHRVGLSQRGKHRRRPSFALRALVQERVAEIIATDIAGYQSHVEIKENTLSVTIDTLKSTADKWMIPRRARKAFRAVAFEVLYFVGEHGLITRGADALYDLTPFEFHGLFGPLLAAMGDAETMEGWLDSTNILAEVDLRRDGTRPSLAATNRSFEASTRNLGKSKSMGEESAGTQTSLRAVAQSERLDAARERQMRNSSNVLPSHEFRRSVHGNAFGKRRHS